MPVVSVVIPIYNPGRLLKRTLDAILAQTVDDLEVLAVDDGGVEDVSWVADVDPRVRLIRQANAGVSAARNRAVAKARADWIAFCDQDDEWLPEKLAAQFAALTSHPRAAFCHTHFWWVTGDTEDRGQPQRITYRGLLADQHVCLSSVVVSREAYWRAGGHDPLLRVMQDYDLFLRLALLADEPPVGVDEPLVRYNLHDANVSRDYLTAYTERLELIRRHRRHAARRSDAESVAAAERGLARSRELYGAQAFDQARTAARDHNITALGMHLSRAARWDPGFVGRQIGRRMMPQI